MKTLVPIHEEMAAIILVYVRENKDWITLPQAEALTRYAKDPFIMRMMGNSFFDNWFNGEDQRRDTIERFTQRVIDDLLIVYL